MNSHLHSNAETLILSETDIEGSLPSELTSLSDLSKSIDIDNLSVKKLARLTHDIGSALSLFPTATLDLSKSLFDGLIHSSLLSLTKLGKRSYWMCCSVLWLI